MTTFLKTNDIGKKIIDIFALPENTSRVSIDMKASEMVKLKVEIMVSKEQAKELFRFMADEK